MRKYGAFVATDGKVPVEGGGIDKGGGGEKNVKYKYDLLTFSNRTGLE